MGLAMRYIYHAALGPVSGAVTILGAALRERIELLTGTVGVTLGACFEPNRVAIWTTWPVLEFQFAQLLVNVP